MRTAEFGGSLFCSFMETFRSNIPLTKKHNPAIRQSVLLWICGSTVINLELVILSRFLNEKQQWRHQTNIWLKVKVMTSCQCTDQPEKSNYFCLFLSSSISRIQRSTWDKPVCSPKNWKGKLKFETFETETT